MKRPNILYFMSDDHSANSISCYGSILAEVFKTPNLDRIGNEGVRMENFYATNSICTPARATVVTGQYGHINGVRTLADELDTENGCPSMPSLIHDSGYTTAMIGKWHVGSRPAGFDEYKYLVDKFGTDKPGQGIYQDPFFFEKEADDVVRHTGYVSDIITDMSIDWLRKRDADKPFFMMCHHKAPHDFWEYPERHEAMFDGVEIPTPDSLFEDRSHRSIASRDFGSSVTPRNPIRSLYEDFSKENYVTGPLKVADDASFEDKGNAAYQKYLKDYLRTVAGIDDSVGAILDELEAQGELDNTLIIYTSDQGMFLGEHDYQDKRWSFEESLRSPFLVRYPKEIKAGSVCNELACNLDVAPLLLDVAGVEIPEEIQGVSFKKLLSGEVESVRDSVYFRYWMHLAHRHDNPAHYGIRTKDYKLIFYYGLPLDATGTLEQKTPAGWELYDLKNDPKECQNVYGKEGYDEITTELKALLADRKKFYKDEDGDYPELLERLANTK
ncbi:MAG: sulfatase [Clostridia bacterium]